MKRGRAQRNVVENNARPYKEGAEEGYSEQNFNVKFCLFLRWKEALRGKEGFEWKSSRGRCKGGGRTKQGAAVASRGYVGIFSSQRHPVETPLS